MLMKYVHVRAYFKDIILNHLVCSNNLTYSNYLTYPKTSGAFRYR